MSLRKLSLLLTTAVLGTSALHAQGTYPERAVTIVVPYAAGGPTDVIGRALAEKLGSSLGQPVVIENKPGANEAIGAAFVANANPDGHTAFFGTDAAMSLNPHLYKKLSYNPEKDLIPVTKVAASEMLLVVPAGGPQNLADFIKGAKAATQPLSYASAGVGNPTHLSMEWLGRLAGIKVNHIPYRGISPAIPDLMANRVSAMFSGVSSVLPQIREGKLVAIATSGSARSSVLPNVPTFAEQGFKNFDASFYLGLALPAGTPAAVVNKLAAEVRKVVQSPGFRQQARELWGIEPVGDKPEEFAAFLVRDRATAAERVKISGARLE